MDRLERFEDNHGTMVQMLQSQQSEVWTALPGIIESFNPVAMTCEVQPAVQIQLTNPNDRSQKSWMDISLLVDCPVYFPSGGGCTLTFPIAKGDECLVVFASRCIDTWWQSGGHQNQQAIMRMHDLSDGFVFAGVRSQPRVIANVSTNSTQLRSDDGTAIIELNPTSHAINLKGSTITIDGHLIVNGNVDTTGTLTNNGHDVGSPHQHLNSGGSGLGGIPQ